MTDSVSPQIQYWASRQLADYDARRPGMIFSEGVNLDTGQAYQLQAAVTRLRTDRGEKVIGYKVGCTSPKIRHQLGIDHSISGHLFDSERHTSNAVMPRDRFAGLAIEGELAVELSREPSEDDFSDDVVPECVARLFPVIELHNHVIRGDRPSAGELIANNAIHAGFVAGNALASGAETSLEVSELSISSNDSLLDRCSGPELIRTVNSSLKWLAQSMRERGSPLRAGQIILTGSISSLIPISEDCTIRIDAPPLGSVEVQFVS